MRHPPVSFVVDMPFAFTGKQKVEGRNTQSIAEKPTVRKGKVRGSCDAPGSYGVSIRELKLSSGGASRGPAVERTGPLRGLLLFSGKMTLLVFLAAAAPARLVAPRLDHGSVFIPRTCLE
jgi:hypothetical protein